MEEMISQDVSTFLDRSASLIGKHAAENFSQNRFCELTDLKLESPIEHMLYIAILALSDLAYFPYHDVLVTDSCTHVSGLDVQPQVTIKKYRVDFLVSWYGYPGQPSEATRKRVVVECDSQAWHERTEEERRYEKKRDRDLLRLGYQVFRFTGKEIKDNPFRVALEVLNYVTGRTHEDVLEWIEELEVIR